MAEEKQVNAMFRRHEQLKRWEDSETNREPGSPKLKPRKVQFQDGCIFLAACSSGDREEVTRLLDRGADINTANVDGLTALHQACIDDNLEMVEFLVEKVADVDVCDNEGWTPLHATASCGFTEIARYLIKMGANIAAVNNDGDLPIDICEDEEMENLLQAELDKQGIDADEARKEEENRMLADANQWLNSRIIKEKKHAKTGATALHVAAAKGYITVVKVLLQAGVDINAEDNDGWTPLHAAAHWAQCEACQMLVEQLCDMEKKNTAGQTALDVADEDMKKFLEDLKKKQVLMRSRAEEMNEDIIQTKGPPNKRRSSVTRMSGDQKQNVLHKTSEQERVALETNKFIKRGSDKVDSSGSEEEGSTETERQNEINKQTSQTDKPQERDHTPTRTEVDKMPIIDEVSETEKIQEKENVPEKNISPDRENIPEIVETEKCSETENTSQSENTPETEITLETEITPETENTPETDNSLETENTPEKDNTLETENTPETDNTLETENTLETDKTLETENTLETDNTLETENTSQSEMETITESEIILPATDETVSVSNGESVENSIEEETPNSVKDSNKSLKDSSNSTIKDTSIVPPPKELISRSISAPSSLPTDEEGLKISTNHKSRDNDYSAWRAGLRKTGSTSMVHERMSKENEDDRSLPRSASSPRLAFDPRIEDDRNGTRRSSQGTTGVSSPDKGDAKVTDRHSHTGGSMDQSRSPYRSLSSYNSSGLTYHSQYEPYYRRMNDRTSRKDGQDYQDRIISRTPSILSTVTTTTGPLSTTTVSTTSVSSATTTVTSPTTPTSTNSVFRRSYEPPKRDEETETQRKARAKRARETRRSTQGVSLEDIEKAEETLRNSSTDKDREKLRLSQKDVTDSASTESRDVPRDSGRDSNRTSSSLPSKDTSSEDTSYRRRNLEERHEDDTRSSFRRSRDQPRDLSSSSSQYSSDNSTSAYIPRSQRNALSTSDTNTTTSLTGSSGLARTSSYRSRLRNGEVSSREEEQKTAREEPKKDESKKDHEEKKESSALQKRRARRERRSTGIVTYTPDDDEDEKGKENKPEEEKKDEYGVHGLLDSSRYLQSTLGSRYGSSRYSSSTDMTPTDRYRDRPSSYSEYSRSTPSSLDSDYKKLYEDEKSENERLRRELEQTKRELRDAKTELDKMMRKHTDAARTAETNDKRVTPLSESTLDCDQEKRALERKVSELEEELKKMDSLKNDNLRLREENGALIRVISKLSK
ncbi:protein phosphatase 1 regulatory subunit 12A-like isoform X3 [Haliotis rufescens]|uniref:protein phosphatase 1 regulatory subunit 12A-like isoform X3 n=1 Tax=Haliotis rufescens TaxID=6454 RepID=UPI00201EBA3C|nr:protein phosphatase 1 regulatory subunit 12A-like isoform X3 [Haliotis rufescens]